MKRLCVLLLLGLCTGCGFFERFTDLRNTHMVPELTAQTDRWLADQGANTRVCDVGNVTRNGQVTEWDFAVVGGTKIFHATRLDRAGLIVVNARYDR